MKATKVDCKECGSPFTRNRWLRAGKCWTCTERSRKDRSIGPKPIGYYRAKRGDKHPSWNMKEIRSHCGTKNKHRPYMCQACGFDVIVENAHIRPVSSFPDSATLDEVNDPSNVLKLCPNHHAMYDSGDPKLKKEVEDLIGS